MQYHALKEKLNNFRVFSVSDIRKIDPRFYPARLTEWQKKGYIKKIRRGYYIFANEDLNEESLFLIANRIYAPSYVSFESALSYYELIPEGVYFITSASGKKTSRFHTPIAEFTYRRMRPQLFFGYILQKQGDQAYKIAEIEKAVLDYIYVNPRIVQDADFHEWRFNGEEFLARADIQKFGKYAKAYNNKGLLARAERFLTLIKKLR